MVYSKCCRDTGLLCLSCTQFHILYSQLLSSSPTGKVNIGFSLQGQNQETYTAWPFNGIHANCTDLCQNSMVSSYSCVKCHVLTTGEANYVTLVRNVPKVSFQYRGQYLVSHYIKELVKKSKIMCLANKQKRHSKASINNTYDMLYLLLLLHIQSQHFSVET